MLLAVAICAVLPTIVRAYSLVLSTQYAAVGWAASFPGDAAVRSWIVVLTPGLTVTSALGGRVPVIGAWWVPSSAPTVMLTGETMSIVNWPFASVVRVPMPGTLSTMSVSGVFTSAL